VLKGKQTDGFKASEPRGAPLLLLLAQRHLMGTYPCTLGGGEGFGDHRSGHASALPQPESPPPDLPAHSPPWQRWASFALSSGLKVESGGGRACARGVNGRGRSAKVGANPATGVSPMATPSTSHHHPNTQPHQTGTPEHDLGKVRACREAKSATGPRSSEPPPSSSARAEHGDDQVSMPQCIVPSARAWNAGFGTSATLWLGAAAPRRLLSRTGLLRNNSQPSCAQLLILGNLLRAGLGLPEACKANTPRDLPLQLPCCPPSPLSPRCPLTR